jgi:hypothetical protein
VARTFAVSILIGLLALCPLLCGAAEVGHGIHRDRAPVGAPDEPHGPAHCPDSADNCICEGAVQPATVHVPDADSVSDGPPWLAVLLSAPPLHPLAHLTWGGTPTGLAGWGDGPTIRALLQNFRC